MRALTVEPGRAGSLTGAGPIGLLAALLGTQRGLDIHVLDRVTAGPKPGLVEALGATYHHDPADEVAARLEPDVVIEATGAGQVVFDVMAHTVADAFETGQDVKVVVSLGGNG